MKITNVNRLPEQLINLVQSDYKPTPKRYSCTTILKPTRQIILERKYNDEIEQDISDMCWLVFGIAVHSIIENSQESTTQFKEEKLSMDLGKICKELDGYVLSGRSDLIDLGNKKIYDWKTCSCWKIIFKDYDDWKKETLIYAWLVKQLGFEINSGEIVAFIKDYQEIEKFIIDKFLEIKKYENVLDEELPLCTPEERYNTGDKYAVKKKNNKRASKIHDTLEEAQKHLDNLEKDYPNIYEIEIRKSQNTRCEQYCSVCKFCDFYRKINEKKGKK